MMTKLSRVLVSLLFVALLFAVSFAQKQAAAPAPVSQKQAMDQNAGKQMQGMKCNMEEKSPSCMMKNNDDDEDEEEFQGVCSMMSKGCFPNGRFFASHKMIAHKALKMLAGCMFLCFLTCALLHVLLTILVFNDMRKRNEMNGLWIPIILIGGVCTTVIYAIFRMK
jgi:hypothetical protein